MNQNARRSARLGALMLVAVAATLGLAACGGAKSPAVASLGTTTSSSDAGQTNTTDTSGRGAPESQVQVQADALKYSQCMRSHGEPSFPDPSPGGGFVFPAGSGVTPGSPTFQAAQAKCQKYNPAPPGLGAGTQTHPIASRLAGSSTVYVKPFRLRKSSACRSKSARFSPGVISCGHVPQGKPGVAAMCSIEDVQAL